jgi:dihydroorotate dehydrogenase (fumarate)
VSVRAPWPRRAGGDLEAQMQAHAQEWIAQMPGSMSSRVVREPATFDRANYTKVLGTYPAP